MTFPNFSRDMWTKETTRRTLRTFFQAFFGVLATGITVALAEWGTPAFRVAVGALIGTAIASGIAAIMNIEYVPDGNPGGQDEEASEVVAPTEEVADNVQD